MAVSSGLVLGALALSAYGFIPSILLPVSPIVNPLTRGLTSAHYRRSKGVWRMARRRLSDLKMCWQSVGVGVLVAVGKGRLSSAAGALRRLKGGVFICVSLFIYLTTKRPV